MKKMIAHYEDTRSNTFFNQLINLKKKSLVVENIERFQTLNIKVTNIPDDNLIDVFIGTVKDNIQHEFDIWEPTSLENAFKVVIMLKVKIWLWLLQGPPLTSIERIMFLLLNHLNLQG
jgi:hypothetical protein